MPSELINAAIFHQDKGVSFRTLLAFTRFARDELSINVREALECVHNEDNDFEIEVYRFIRSADIDGIIAEELENDAYVLGCFNASFIADVTGWPIALVEAAQKGESFEEIGQGIIDGGHVEAMAKAYAAADGYGHHFSHYDHSERECGDYLVFRVE